MKKTIQAILFACALPVFAWAALSVYFLLAGWIMAMDRALAAQKGQNSAI